MTLVRMPSIFYNDDCYYLFTQIFIEDFNLLFYVIVPQDKQKIILFNPSLDLLMNMLKFKIENFVKKPCKKVF